MPTYPPADVERAFNNLQASRGNGTLAAACRRVGIDVVVMFGSALDVPWSARVNHPRDVDLAYFLPRGAPVRANLMAVDALLEIAKSDAIDVMPGHLAGDVALYAATVHGELLYETEPGMFDEKRLLARRWYEHEEHFRRKKLKSRGAAQSFRRDQLCLRLDQLRNRLAFIEPHQGVTASDLAADDTLRFAVERVLSQMVEAAVDIHAHIVVNSGNRLPQSSRDSFKAVAALGVLSADQAKDLEHSVGLRNVLIHEYLETDLQILADAVDLAGKQYRDYVESVDRWLTTAGSESTDSP